MDETEQLRQATREAHEAMKDMKALMRDCRVLIAEVETVAAKQVDRRIREAIEYGLAVHMTAIQDAIGDSEKMIYERFGKIADILLGEDRNARRAGSAIQELTQQWVAEQS